MSTYVVKDSEILDTCGLSVFHVPGKECGDVRIGAYSVGVLYNDVLTLFDRKLDYLPPGLEINRDGIKEKLKNYNDQ